MKARGQVGSLAVSNFSPAQLDAIIQNPGTTCRPDVNQLPFSVAYHPGGLMSPSYCSTLCIIIHIFVEDCELILPRRCRSRFRGREPKAGSACSSVGASWLQFRWKVFPGDQESVRRNWDQVRTNAGLKPSSCVCGVWGVRAFPVICRYTDAPEYFFRYGKSGAQVALRWIIQKGASFTCQSTNKDHFAENIDVFDFTLSTDEMTILSNLA